MRIIDPYGLIRPVPAQTHERVRAPILHARRGQRRTQAGPSEASAGSAKAGAGMERAWDDLGARMVGTAWVVEVRPGATYSILYNTGGRHGVRRESPPRRCPCQQLSMQTALATNARTQGPNSVLHARPHAQRQSCAHASDTHTHTHHACKTPLVVPRCTYAVLSPLLAAHLNASPRCAVLGACRPPTPAAVLCRRRRRRGRR